MNDGSIQNDEYRNQNESPLISKDNVDHNDQCRRWNVVYES